ncbi:MAG: transcriptional repressor [Oscillospiraceae bacterium]|nr:transcriptional repressor [Oscillospiraceae bacterium]
MEAQKQFRKRNAILSYLQATKEHPSAEMVYMGVKQDCPDISLATVYRNLALFRNQGLIQCVGTVKGIERFDGNTAPHVHFFCTECGNVLDLPEVKAPSQLSEDVEKGTGGKVNMYSLSFAGICKKCIKNKI